MLQIDALRPLEVTEDKNGSYPTGLVSGQPTNDLVKDLGDMDFGEFPISGGIDYNLILDMSLSLKAYTPEQAIEVAATWLVTGKSVKTEKLTGVPAATIRYWYRLPLWKELVMVLRRAKQEELDAKLTGIIMDASEELQDRVKNGDYVKDEDGQLDRIPMKGTDLAKVTGITYDKRAMLRANPTDKLNPKSSNIEDSLKKLATAFEAMSRRVNEKVIEGEVIHDNA